MHLGAIYAKRMVEMNITLSLQISSADALGYRAHQYVSQQINV